MNSTASKTVTPERIMQMAWGYAPPLILETAIRLKIFDTLDNGAKTIDEVHQSTGVSKRGLASILNVLVGLELLSKEDNRYALAPESAAFLVSHKPSFQGGLILHTSEHLIPRWLNLREIVKTGKPVTSVNQKATGEEFFQKFVDDIYPMSYPAAHHLAQHLAMTGPQSVLDLAAGSGVWGLTLAQSSDQVHVTVVDWAGVVPVARKNAEKLGLTSRYTFIEGDLADADFGSAHAVATLGHILHSEGEVRSRKLLKKTANALASGGTIAIAEFLVNKERTGPVGGLIFSMNMLVNTDEGDTFSFEEISTWLLDAGFINPRLLPAPGPSPLILATKP
jgi:3-hydroxy-5-methyl-1-naphthoate 3-O-methyltransferase